MAQFKIKRFNELSTAELYDLLRLRSEVFVAEQNCVYQDIDNKDQKAIHVLGYLNQELIACSRVFAPGDYFEFASIGRVIVAQKQRANSFGNELMNVSIQVVAQHFNTTKITISAQEYLKKFYESHGFIQTSKPYLEDGIPHIEMKTAVLNLSNQ